MGEKRLIFLKGSSATGVPMADKTFLELFHKEQNYEDFERILTSIDKTLPPTISSETYKLPLRKS